MELELKVELKVEVEVELKVWGGREDQQPPTTPTMPSRGAPCMQMGRWPRPRPRSRPLQLLWYAAAEAASAGCGGCRKPARPAHTLWAVTGGGRRASVRRRARGRGRHHSRLAAVRASMPYLGRRRRKRCAARTDLRLLTATLLLFVRAECGCHAAALLLLCCCFAAAELLLSCWVAGCDR